MNREISYQNWNNSNTAFVNASGDDEKTGAGQFISGLGNWFGDNSDNIFKLAETKIKADTQKAIANGSNIDTTGNVGNVGASTYVPEPPSNTGFYIMATVGVLVVVGGITYFAMKKKTGA